jgi:site-specific DNA-cytosine methylase
VNEAGRLMGFDTEFAHLASGSKGFEQVVSDVQAYKQYGNAVVPGVVRAIGKEIKRLLRTKD